MLVINNRFLILFFLLILGCSSKTLYTPELKNSLKYDLKQINQNQTNSDVKLSIFIPLNKMVFKKNNNKFHSDITVDIIVTNENNQLIYSESWNEEITKKYYEDTRTSEYFIAEHFFQLPVGFYSVTFIVNDFENHINFVNNEKFEVIKNQDLLGPNLFYKINNEYMYFLEDKRYIDTIWVQYEVLEIVDYNKVNELKFSYNFYYKGSVVYDSTFIQKIDNKNLSQYVPISLLNESFDKLDVIISYNNKIRAEEIKFENRVTYNYSMEYIIEPMIYVLDKEEYIEYSTFNKVEKVDFLNKYWEYSDNPEEDNVRINLFKEFYARVKYANENYQHMNTMGWKNDRGKIYIVNGKPHEIKHEFNHDGEFEIWFYPNKEFVFINKFGRYDLYRGGNY